VLADVPWKEISVDNFTGYAYDEVLHIYYAQNRFYGPDNRRFVQQDATKDGHNWYSYCGNNPVTFYDPLGFAEGDIRTDDKKAAAQKANQPNAIKPAPLKRASAPIQKTPTPPTAVTTVKTSASSGKVASHQSLRFTSDKTKQIQKEEFDPRVWGGAAVVATGGLGYAALPAGAVATGTGAFAQIICEGTSLATRVIEALKIFRIGSATKIGWETINTGDTSNTSLARQLGKEGEEAAGIVNTKTRIDSLSGTAKYRIPDELLKDEKILREIKNVSNLSYTNQLRDFNAWAKQNGYQFVLEVRPGAELSGPLQEAINKGDIILKTIGQ